MNQKPRWHCSRCRFSLALYSASARSASSSSSSQWFSISFGQFTEQSFWGWGCYSYLLSFSLPVFRDISPFRQSQCSHGLWQQISYQGTQDGGKASWPTQSHLFQCRVCELEKIFLIFVAWQRKWERASQICKFDSPTICVEFLHLSVALGSASCAYLSSGLLLMKIPILCICFWFSVGSGE